MKKKIINALLIISVIAGVLLVPAVSVFAADKKPDMPGGDPNMPGGDPDMPGGDPTGNEPEPTGNPQGGANANKSDLDTQKCSNPKCYSPAKHGSFWIKMVADSDNISPGEIGFGYTMSASTPIVGCQTLGGYAYVLVTRMYYRESGAPTGEIAGEVPLYRAWGKFVEDTGPLGISKSAEYVSEETAHAAFQQYEAAYNAMGMFYEPGSHLAWFCAEAGEVPPPSTKDPIEFKACDEISKGSSLRGTTISRIAVINNTLDYESNIQDKAKYRWETVRGPRAELKTEAEGEGSDSVETLAKPGDSIQFQHCISFGVRFARVAVKESDKNVWVSRTTHSGVPDGKGGRLKMADQHFEVDATRSKNYIFKNQAPVVSTALSVVNKFTAADVLNGLESNTADSLYVNKSKALVAFLSPSLQTAYDCMDRYPESGFYRGSFQVPGFKAGAGCNASNETGETTEVGKEITQKHTYNLLRLYEQLNHKGSYNCGCPNKKDASGPTNYSNGGVNSGFGEGDSGNRKEPYECIYSGECQCEYSELYYDPSEDKWKRDKISCEEDYSLNSSDYKYNHIYENEGDQIKTATVFVPYNYTTTVGSGLEAGDVIFQGTKISSTFSWSINPRANDKTSLLPYATHTTPDTKVRMVEFITNSKNVEGNIKTKQDPCSYYGGNCVEIGNADGMQNKYGLVGGAQYGATKDRIVPDDGDYVGMKYCVAIGIYPTDSHDYEENTLDAQKTYNADGDGTAMDSGVYWNISGASCRTIAKKPNFQVWNGSVYTDNSIITSLTKKQLGSGRGDWDNNAKTTLFGSWADYAIISRRGVYGMASGAMLGYENGSYNFGLPGGADGNSDQKDLSPMTIRNNNTPVGNSNLSAQVSVNLNMARLRSRYQDKAKSYAEELEKKGLSGIAKKKVYTAPTGFQFIDYSGDISVSSIAKDVVNNNNIEAAKLAMDTLTIGSNGLYKSACNKGNQPCDGVDNVLVINIRGKLTVDKNICYTNRFGTGCSDDSTTLNNYRTIKNALQYDSINAPANLPQIIIFANNISIAENVSRIDAWLISDSIDTCNVFVEQVTPHTRCSTTLTVNGPVFTKKLYLHRNAGASYGRGTGDGSDVLNRHLGNVTSGSIAPGEIFNLRADTYAWAYNQAQRYSEAVVTYMRELAPRY